MLKLGVSYSVQGTPSAPIWLLLRMGDSVATEVIFLPPPYKFRRFSKGQAGGYGGGATLEGVSFERAYAEGLPLEIFLMRGDGTIIERQMKLLADRSAASQVVDARWREVLDLSKSYRLRCQPSEIVE